MHTASRLYAKLLYALKVPLIIEMPGKVPSLVFLPVSFVYTLAQSVESSVAFRSSVIGSMLLVALEEASADQMKSIERVDAKR